jgi:hypothetical protein
MIRVFLLANGMCHFCSHSHGLRRCLPLVALLASAAVIPRTPGNQFITGACAVDSDCAQGCCGFNTGKCAGPVIALERDGGCGFGSGKANANAAKALGQFPGAVAAFEAKQGGAAPVQNGAAAAPAPAPAAPKGKNFRLPRVSFSHLVCRHPVHHWGLRYRCRLRPGMLRLQHR